MYLFTIGTTRRAMCHTVNMRHNSLASLPRRIRTLLLFTVGLIALLIFHSLIVRNITDYTYLIWNFVLAALPALVIYLTPLIAGVNTRVLRRSVALVLALVWLALLPNTFYLLTEFTHLNPHVLVNLPHNQTMGSIAYGRASALYVLDSLMMLITALFGAYTGAAALSDGYRMARKKLPKTSARILLLIVLLLVPIGVYIGRYGRWNSWDLIIHPWEIMTNLASQLTQSSSRESFIIFVITIMCFELSSLYALRKLALTDATSQ